MFLSSSSAFKYKKWYSVSSFLAHPITYFCEVKLDFWFLKMYVVMSANETEPITACQLSDRCWVTWGFELVMRVMTITYHMYILMNGSFEVGPMDLSDAHNMQ